MISMKGVPMILALTTMGGDEALQGQMSPSYWFFSSRYELSYAK